MFGATAGSVVGATFLSSSSAGPAAAVADVLTCTRLHTTLEAAGIALDANAERYLKSPAEMRALFAHAPEIISNARALAESPHLGPLCLLQLDSNPIGDEGLTALARSTHLAAEAGVGQQGTDRGGQRGAVTPRNHQAGDPVLHHLG